MTFELTAGQAAELETMRRETLAETTERWALARETVTRGCPHETITYRPGEPPQCEACEARMVGAIWATTSGSLVVGVPPH